MAIRHEIRINGKEKTKFVQLTPMKAIRLNCIECMGHQPSLVSDCTDSLCPLFPFRMGRTTTSDKSNFA
jgi:hypothetical protein